MAITVDELKNLLVESEMLTGEKFDEAMEEAKVKNVPIEVHLSQNGYIQDKHLGQLIADQMNAKFVDLNNQRLEEKLLNIIPEEVSRKQEIVAFKEDENDIHLATTNPDNYEEISLIEKKTGKKAVVYYATPLGIRKILKEYKAGIQSRIDELLTSLESKGDSAGISDNAISLLVDLLLEFANDSWASDIHIEPMKELVQVRLRIDGVLHEVARYPSKFHDKVVSRVKILSKLSIDEHAAAQDGRFSYSRNDEEFDVRVSILPTTKGENVVMRILSEGAGQLFMDDLGLGAADLEKLKSAAKKPYGMILSVGPTGAGKTTSLYSILHLLNQPDVNIMTIEDPVEYEIDEVRQTQVNLKKNITFAQGLRSIVRQDPDVIMIGEIRDDETANIAVNSAMTGHLVLSTLHANDAATTFPRLLDMQVEPFLVASSVNIVVAQRLVRKVCEKCRHSVMADEAVGEMLKNQPDLAELLKSASGKEDLSAIRLYRGEGCQHCEKTGYLSRTGIFEVMEVDEEIKKLIIERASANVINDKAVELGMKTMMADGIDKVLQGVTTLEELVRVTKS